MTQNIHLEIYNDLQAKFIMKLRELTRIILRDECHLRFDRKRVHKNHFTFPLSFVVYEGPKKWAYFDHLHYTIAFHKDLMYLCKEEVLKNIIRHELAHYLAFIEFGEKSLNHGFYFKSLIGTYGWPRSVSLSTMDLEVENALAEDASHEKLMSKVKKLLNLSSSSNTHESQLAMLKANELILKHHLNSLDFNLSQTPECFVIVCFEGRKILGLHRAISHILDEFYVSTVFDYGTKSFRLKAIGQRSHVILAQWISEYLLERLPLLWKEYQIKHPQLKGLAQKNLFFHSLAQSFVEEKKKQLDTRTHSPQEQRALIIGKNQLEKMKERVFPRLGRIISKNSLSEKEANLSRQAGTEAGKNLKIYRPLEQETSNTVYFLEP